MKITRFLILFSTILICFLPGVFFAAEGSGSELEFPLPLSAYNDSHLDSVVDILKDRIHKDPFNLVATIIFLLAIIHAFLASNITKLSHRIEHRHREKLKRQNKKQIYEGHVEDVSFKAQILHFLGEVEAVFGIWVVVLFGSFLLFKDSQIFISYLDHVNYTEAMFVVVIMTLSASRPIIQYSERCVKFLAGLLGGQPWAYWLIILTILPVLGSFITEPAAMTIAAMLISKEIFAKNIPTKLAYATIGLLFVNISVGGTFTNFAAPPVLMVSGTWGWSSFYMMSHFGWKALVGIFISTSLYFFIFRKTLMGLKPQKKDQGSEEDGVKVHWDERTTPVPLSIFVCHLIFIGLVVFFAHHSEVFIGLFLFFLAFIAATVHHQYRTNIKSPILVGFFLAGLVIHGGLQAWWIAPVLESLNELTLFWGATALTAFNDNAAITYLSSLVPDFSDAAKYAVVAGAVTGGGLTVIANAPNPAGQAILGKHFDGGVSPLNLALGAAIPTLIMAACFLLL